MKLIKNFTIVISNDFMKNAFYIVFCLLCTSFFVHANDAVSADCSEPCSVTNEDKKDSRILRGAVIDYLDVLNNVDELSFKKNMNTNNTMHLVEEIRIVKKHFKNILISVNKIMNGSSLCSVKEWLLISQNLSRSMRYMEDFELFNLIKKRPNRTGVAFFDIVGIPLANENINIKLSLIK